MPREVTRPRSFLFVNDPEEKRLACHNHRSTSKDPELQAYFDACKGWYRALTATQQGIADEVVGLQGSRFLLHDMLKVLPPAPECTDELLSKHPEIAR